MGQVATTPEQALALEAAVDRNALDEVTSLVASGVSANYPTDGRPVLVTAVEKGYTDVADYLIQHGADVNILREDDLQGALHLVAASGSEDLCGKLLCAGAKVDIWNRKSMTPLFLSIVSGHEVLVEMLLKAGASPNSNYKSNGSDSKPGVFLPLHQATTEHQNEIGTLLCQHGVLVNARDLHGRSSLHLAARLGNIEMVRTLIDNDACVDCTDEDLMTPLHCACREGHVEVARALIERGCSVNVQRKGWGCEKYTPLHEATQHNHGETVNLLCWAQANVNAEDYYSKTPLHIACEKGYHCIVKTLIAYGCDTNKKDIGGFTPIFEAVKQKRFDSVQALLKAMCMVNVTDGSGRTPLHFAAEKGLHDMVDDIMVHGANINKLDKFRCTPLHYSMSSGNIKCVFSMLQHGHLLPKRECQVTELLKIVMTSKRFDLFKMLFHMGWRPRANGFLRVTEFIRQTAPFSQLLPWVEYEEAAPTSLLIMCRNVIRTSLLIHTKNTSTMKVIDKLKLPSDVLEFLQLKDLHDKFMANPEETK